MEITIMGYIGIIVGNVFKAFHAPGPLQTFSGFRVSGLRVEGHSPEPPKPNETLHPKPA